MIVSQITVQAQCRDLAHGVCGVSGLSEVLGQDLEAGVEAVWLEPLYGSPLHAQPPGVETGQQSRPAGGTLGADVGLGQLHSSPGQALGGRTTWYIFLRILGGEGVQQVLRFGGFFSIF